MNNEDIVSLMERYKRELLEFEKRNTAPVSAQEKAESEPVSAQQESQAEQVSAQVQEDAEPVNAPAAEPAKAVSAKTEEAEAVSVASIKKPSDTAKEIKKQPENKDADKAPERTHAAGHIDIPQPRTVFVESQTLENKNLASANSTSATQKFDKFKSECNKRGTLRVKTYSSNGLYPVGNSRVVVYKEIDGEKYYIYDSHTDSSGILDNLLLPAPDKSLSQTEQGTGGPAPCATYSIFVSRPGFVDTHLENVPIFDSTVSIQSVEMLPAVSGEPGTTTINESV